MRYNNPDKLSFKDLIAGVVLAFFLFAVKRALGPDPEIAARALSVIQGLTPSVVVILTGYFAAEGYTQWTSYKSKSDNLLGG